MHRYDSRRLASRLCQSSGTCVKRLILGRAVRSDRLGDTLLPKRIALPIFASDPLSSVAYATAGDPRRPDGRRHGLPLLHAVDRRGGVVLLLSRSSLSYRQLVHAYPTGGGDYEVASKNLGPVGRRRRGQRAARRLRDDRRGVGLAPASTTSSPR